MGPTLSSEYVEKTYMIYTSLFDNASTGVNIKCENKELAMRWLDVLLADPEATRTRIIGFEGEDWEYDENQEPVPIVDENGRTSDIVKKGCG